MKTRGLFFNSFFFRPLLFTPRNFFTLDLAFGAILSFRIFRPFSQLKAAQTVFFVRAGHCVSSSVGQTPPPEMADNANDLVTEDNSGVSALSFYGPIYSATTRS